MAAVRKYTARPNHWRAELSLGPDPDRPGKYLRRSFVLCPASCHLQCSPYPQYRARTKTEARAIADRIEEELELARGRDTRLAAVAARWLESKTTIERNTRYSYEAIIRNHIRPHFGATHVQEITPADVQRWVDGFGEKRSTGERALVTLRQILTHAVLERLITVNPAREIKRPRRARAEVAIPTDAELDRFFTGLRDAAGPWLVAYLLLGAETGARRGELAALRWCDVDLEERTLHVDGSIDRWRERKATKTHASRMVPLSTIAVQVLTVWRATVVDEARTDAALDIREPLPEWYVFHSPQHGYAEPRNPNSIGRQLQRHRDALELPPITIKTLRHHFASRVFSATKNDIAGAKLAGWVDATMFRKVYGHPMQEDLRDAIDAASTSSG